MRFGLLLSLVLSLASTALAADKVTIALNWLPEPEFGGIYAAKEAGEFTKHGLDVEISPGGPGIATWQRVAQNKIEFCVSSADEVVVARSKGADIVAIFTTYQTCPQAIMVHASRGLKSIDEVFKSGTLAMEVGLPYTRFLEKKYGTEGAKRTTYTGGIANFLADKSFAQQCFVFSEPLAAKKQGSDPQTFLIADSGYNPYTGVVVTSGKFLKEHPDQVKAMAEALTAGWSQYQIDPKPANEVMGKLNKAMDAETFAAAAEAQKDLVEPKGTDDQPIGSMTEARWTTLIAQLVELKVVKNPPKAAECFQNFLHGG